MNNSQLQSSYHNGNQWYLNDTLIIGETSKYFTPKQSGNYSVGYTSEEGCEIISDDFTYTVSSVEEQEHDDISIFPNPVSNSLFIKNESLSSSHYYIINSMGLTLKEVRFNGNKVDVSTLIKGVYIINLRDDQGQWFNSIFVKE